MWYPRLTARGSRYPRRSVTTSAQAPRAITADPASAAPRSVWTRHPAGVSSRVLASAEASSPPWQLALRRRALECRAMQNAVNAFLLGFPALFSIVNPPSVAFIFREVTAGRGRDERGLLARKVAFFSFLVLVVSLWIGSYVLAFFGITLAALRIA